MVSVIGQLLPLMVAIALSTIPVMVTVTILLAPNPAPSALSFLIGWLLGMFLVTGLLALGVQSLPARSLRSQPAIGLVEVIIGGVIIGYGVFLLIRKRNLPPQTELPHWLRAVGTMKPGSAFGLAFVLNLRPKAVLLSTAAALILGSSRLSISEGIAVLIIFVAVGGSTVWVPILLALADQEKLRGTLEATERWIVKYGSTATILVSFIIGIFVLGDGLMRL